MKKKGMSHVEIVISFIIFAAFVSFLLVAFKPFKIFSQLNDAYLDTTEKQILKNISANLMTYSIKINSTAYESPASQACFRIKNKTADEIFIMKNANGEIAGTRKTGNWIYFENKGDFYRVYAAQDELNAVPLTEPHPDPESSCHRLEDGEYAFGIQRTYEVVSNRSLAVLVGLYEADYDKLKSELGLQNDFYISARDSSGFLFKPEERYKPSGINILAREMPIQILYRNAEIKPAIINIQVWD